MNAPKEDIMTEARLQQLASSKREKRKYIKRNESYWCEDIFTKRQKINFVTD